MFLFLVFMVVMVDPHNAVCIRKWEKNFLKICLKTIMLKINLEKYQYLHFTIHGFESYKGILLSKASID